jgi:hypothetical protein
MSDPNDVLFGSEAPAISADDGLVVRGRVTKFDARQRRKFDRNAPKNQGKLMWFENGTTVEADEKPSPNARPVLDPVFTVQTAFAEWEATSENFAKVGKDDGLRRIFVTGRSKEAREGSLLEVVREATKNAGCGRTRKVQEGDYIEVRIVGKGKPVSKGLNAPWLWECDYWLSSNPPEWASELPSDDVSDVEDDEDNPFA